MDALSEVVVRDRVLHLLPSPRSGASVMMHLIDTDAVVANSHDTPISLNTLFYQHTSLFSAGHRDGHDLWLRVTATKRTFGNNPLLLSWARYEDGLTKPDIREVLPSDPPLRMDIRTLAALTLVLSGKITAGLADIPVVNHRIIGTNESAILLPPLMHGAVPSPMTLAALEPSRVLLINPFVTGISYHPLPRCTQVV
jgi:hypothetical protein